MKRREFLKYSVAAVVAVAPFVRAGSSGCRNCQVGRGGPKDRPARSGRGDHALSAVAALAHEGQCARWPQAQERPG